MVPEMFGYYGIGPVGPDPSSYCPAIIGKTSRPIMLLLSHFMGHRRFLGRFPITAMEPGVDARHKN